MLKVFKEKNSDNVVFKKKINDYMFIGFKICN